jgi:predicted ATPase/DNA-binding SARP family transcriptional activator
VELRVLGPIELWDASGPIPVGAAKLRALLAALAVAGGAVRTADELIDALWGERPPPSAAKLLHVYVSQLRKILPGSVAITTSGNGYALAIEPDATDAATFERLASDGRAALRVDNPALAASLLRRALALWRGPAYADVRYEPFVAAEADRLDGLRAAATNDRIDADLRLGRHAEVLAELRGRLGLDATDERVAGQALLAAYRAEGVASALAIFELVESAMRGELGEPPDETLVALRDRIVRRDPALALPVDAAGGASRSALPVAPNPLIGRAEALRALAALVARPHVRLVSLTGAGGSGKSRLALALAHEVANSFANGATLVELASLQEPDLVPSTIAAAVGVEPGADAWSALAAGLADQERLLVLDNFEHLLPAAPAVIRLLAAAPRLVVVVTTRVVLHVSGEHVYPVVPLDDGDAARLFVERASADDPSFSLDDATGDAIGSICRQLDGLPLPIELAAARVRVLGLRALEERLGSRLSLLTHGPRDLPARQQTLRETLAWSVGLLDRRPRDVLARLAIFPSGCSLDAAVSVAGADDETLTTLVDHHLVGALELRGARRYRLLQTVREYADELLGTGRGDAELALVDWVVGLVTRLDMNNPSPANESLRVLDDELDTLRDALRYAARDAGPERELALAAGVWRYWWIRGLLAEGRTLLEDILDRRGIVPTQAGVRVARAAASLAWSMGDRDRARSLAEQALAAAEAIDDPFERHATNNLLGVISTTDGDVERAEHHHREAIRVAETHGLDGLAMTSMLNLGITYSEAGRIDDARERFHLVLERRLSEGRSEGVGFARINLGELEYLAGDLAAAEAHYLEAIECFKTVGFHTRLANSLQGLAAVEAATGRSESAARRLGRAAALLGERGWAADGSGLAATATGAARDALGDERFDELFHEGAADRDEPPRAAP